MELKINFFTLTQNSQEIFHRLRWGDQIYCPECGSIHIYNPEAGRQHICADCDYRFSDTSRTIFHSTKLPLTKWLMAIYLFCTQSKGISSYNLARLISVSQNTSYRMLMLLRESIHHDLATTDTAIIDEVYLGADWKKKPAKDKYKRVEELGLLPEYKHTSDPIADKHRFRKEVRGKMMLAASLDKIPILGISAYNSRSLILHPFSHRGFNEAIKSQINERYEEITHWVSDQSQLYNWMDDTDGLIHSICNHSKHLYTSPDGFSSNRLEGVFSHLKRVWRGIYHWFSKQHSTAYLNEFSWRWSHFDKPIEEKMKMIFRYATY